jgi:hypothetical protein
VSLPNRRRWPTATIHFTAIEWNVQRCNQKHPIT